MSWDWESVAASLSYGSTYSVDLGNGSVLPVRWSNAPLEEAVDTILIDRPERLETLARLEKYRYLHALLDVDCLDYAQWRKVQTLEWLNQGIYVFGAYKVGTRIARQAKAAGINVIGFLDNDSSKEGQLIEGVKVSNPAGINLNEAVVVIASGRYGNVIQKQLQETASVHCVNMHEFRYALGLPHCAEADFGNFVHATRKDAFRFISAFLRLDDERSRQVFDGLIGMRTRLSIELAESIRSNHEEEYFDKDFVTPQCAARFVDAGAFDGDTLQRLERHFGPVEQAWLFEPELPAYYKALHNYSDRENVWLFNMGLDEKSTRMRFRPDLSFDAAGEIKGPFCLEVISYIQGVPLDKLLPPDANVGLFKLDIEGMEARAIRGARATIERDRPVLAVCAYHRADDYWRLMDEVLKIRSDYRVGIRQYADFLADATLYFY